MFNAKPRSCCDPQRYHKIYFLDSYFGKARRAFCNRDWPFWFVLSRIKYCSRSQFARRHLYVRTEI